jgi:hypothetical protein
MGEPIIKYNDFGKCVQIGETGEKLTKENIGEIFRPVVMHYLYGENVHATTMQRNGIDFKIQKEKIDFDVKCRDYGTYKYNDILIETVSVVENNKPGWLYTSKSDVVVYAWFNHNKTGFIDGYLLFLNCIKKFTLNYKNTPSQIKHAKTYHMGNTWTTRNIAIPINDFPTSCLLRIDMKKVFPPETKTLFDF